MPSNKSPFIGLQFSLTLQFNHFRVHNIWWKKSILKLDRYSPNVIENENENACQILLPLYPNGHRIVQHELFSHSLPVSPSFGKRVPFRNWDVHRPTLALKVLTALIMMCAASILEVRVEFIQPSSDDVSVLHVTVAGSAGSLAVAFLVSDLFALFDQLSTGESFTMKASVVALFWSVGLVKSNC